MKCHYCEKEILSTAESSTLKNNKNNVTVYLHYPHCHVRFTTFYKTEKELKEFRKKGFK